MGTTGDLGIMSHVGRTTPEFVRGLWIEKKKLSDR